MHRVSVVGNSGSGKTTIAAELARLIGAPHLDPEQSIIAWAWTRHRVYRDRFLRAMIGPDYPQLRFVRLTTPAEVRAFLAAAGQPR